MAISAPLATARRTTLTTCLCVALAATAGGAHATDPSRAFSNPHANPNAQRAAFAPFAGFSNRPTPSRTHATVVPANTIPVTNCLDDGSAGTLRKAIEGAADGDTIDLSGLSCSTITLQQGALASNVPGLTIQGPGGGALTIDGANVDRVLTGNDLTISDVTLAHGTHLGTYGGGCMWALGNATLTRVQISDCKTLNGSGAAVGGAAMVGGDLTMYASTITGGSASAATLAAGGGAVVGGNVTMTASTIGANIAIAGSSNAYGGGLMALGTVTMHGSHIAGNTARTTNGFAYGGGVHAPYADVQVLDASVISANTAHSDTSFSYGGGINSGLATHPATATTTVSNSTISGNTAESSCASCFISGGGIHAYDTVVVKYSTIDTNKAKCIDASTACQAAGGGASAGGSISGNAMSLDDSTVSSNHAIAGGAPGAIGAGGGLFPGTSHPFVIHNSTIAFNDASTAGGGILASAPQNDPAELISSIVANNQSASGADDIASGVFGASATITGSSNLVTRWDMSTTMPSGTLTADPHLGALTTDEGGTTAVHPIPANSAAIDVGANPDSLGCDQRGFPYRRTYGTGTDIGAYEFQGEKHLFADSFDTTSACPPGP